MPATTPFNPSPTLTEALLTDFANPTLSLSQIAAANNTSLEALSLWIARPEVAQRLESVHHIAAVRTRLVASTLLAPALGTLSTVLDHTRAQINEDAKAPPEKQRTPEQRHRTLETARRAAGRILSLANFNPIPLFSPPRSPPAIQNPGGHAGATRATQQQPIPVPHSPPKEPLASARETPPPQPAPTTRAASVPNPTAPNRSLPSSAHRTSPRSTSRSSLRLPITPASLIAQSGAPTTALLDPPSEHWP